MGKLSITRTPTHISLSWPTVPEATYDLQYSDNFTDRTTLSTHQGTGHIISVTLPIEFDVSKRFFEVLVHVPDNTEVIGRAITAWNGSRVELEWETVARGSYDIFRNGQFRANTTETRWIDTQISSGASYSYKVVFRP